MCVLAACLDPPCCDAARARRDAAAPARDVSRGGRRDAERRVLRAVAAPGAGHCASSHAETIARRLGCGGVAACPMRALRCSRSISGAATSRGATRSTCGPRKRFCASGLKSFARQHRHRRRVDRRQPRAARRGRRSRRDVDRAAVAGARLQGAAHGSGDEKIRRAAGAARRQHEGSVCRAIDPASDHDRPGHARSSADRRGCARHRAAVARSGPVGALVDWFKRTLL